MGTATLDGNNVISCGGIFNTPEKQAKKPTDRHITFDGFVVLMDACSNGEIDEAQRAIDLKIGVNECTEEGVCPIHNSVAAGSIELTKLLLDHNANVNAAAMDMCTPLHLAAAAGHIDIVELLLKAGADPTLKNEDDETPSEVAESDDIVVLIDAFMESGSMTPPTPPTSVPPMSTLATFVPPTAESDNTKPAVAPVDSSLSPESRTRSNSYLCTLRSQLDIARDKIVSLESNAKVQESKIRAVADLEDQIKLQLSDMGELRMVCLRSKEEEERARVVAENFREESLVLVRKLDAANERINGLLEKEALQEQTIGDLQSCAERVACENAANLTRLENNMEEIRVASEAETADLRAKLRALEHTEHAQQAEISAMKRSSLRSDDHMPPARNAEIESLEAQLISLRADLVSESSSRSELEVSLAESQRLLTSTRSDLAETVALLATRTEERDAASRKANEASSSLSTLNDKFSKLNASSTAADVPLSPKIEVGPSKREFEAMRRRAAEAEADAVFIKKQLSALKDSKIFNKTSSHADFAHKKGLDKWRRINKRDKEAEGLVFRTLSAQISDDSEGGSATLKEDWLANKEVGKLNLRQSWVAPKEIEAKDELQERVMASKEAVNSLIVANNKEGIDDDSTAVNPKLVSLRKMLTKTKVESMVENSKLKYELDSAKDRQYHLEKEVGMMRKDQALEQIKKSVASQPLQSTSGSPPFAMHRSTKVQLQAAKGAPSSQAPEFTRLSLRKTDSGLLPKES